MLKTGFFITPEQTYSVYEIEEKGFYRIDFIRPESRFQVDVTGVVYSQVRKKKTFSIGDSAVYDRYLKVQETILSAKFNVDKDSSWENGVYITKTHSVNEKLGFQADTVSHNGVFNSMELHGNGYVIYSYVSDPIYGIALAPLNFSEYRALELTSDTVESSQGSLFYSMDVLKRRYDIAHLDKYDFVVVERDVSLARKRLYEWKESKFPFKGFDTETTGTDICMYGDDHLVGIILGENLTKATYFPFRHDGDFNLPIEFLDELMEVVISEEDKLVAHNKKFDRKVMLFEGYDLHCKWDTLPISIILNPVLGKGIHGEKELMQELDGNHYLELNEIFVNPKDINFAVLTPEIIKYYACPDGINPIKLLQDFFLRLPKYHYRLAELECDLADVKADQEYYGLRVDIRKFEQQYRNCNYVLDMLLNAFRTLTHEDGNINSSQVLANLLYNKMHCKVLLRTNTGQASTSMSAINKLASTRAKKPHNITEDLVDLNGKVVISAKKLANSAYPALVILSKYKEYNKLKTAFYSRFERTMKTGRIFFWVNQNGAATGRQSSPMHQLPSELKDIILSDASDRDFWGPDYSQVELRMIAYLAGEQDLIRLATDPDNDIHRIIGSLITNKPMWAITPEERSVGKRRNFGVVYEISKYGLAGQLYGPGYTEENVKFCDQQLKAFYKRFKRIDRYIKHNAALVKKYGYMETEWFRRRRLFNEVFDPNLEPATLASILRMSNNVPVQGTAADLMKLGEVQMDLYIRKKGWNKIVDGFPLVRIMLSIHDEMIISAHQSIPYEEIIEMITLCMQIPVKDAPPFFVQPARMANWGEHSNDAVAMPIKYRDQVIEDYHKTGKSVFKQSWFRLIVPEEVNTAITNKEDVTSSLIKKYYKECSLEFLRGDYVKECTEEHLKDALKIYIESGFTEYRIDNYLLLLNGYRTDCLEKYMDGLVKEYGTDYKVVGEHVRHPSLTFDLLDVYKKRLPDGLEHEESITEAARLYIEEHYGENRITDLCDKFTASIDEPHVVADRDLFTEQLEPLVEFDKDGNVVFEDVSEESDDIYSYFYTDDPDDIIDIANNKPVYVWELADSIVFDTANMSKESVDRVLSYIFSISRDDGFYRGMLIYNNQLLQTGLRIEDIDIEAANNMMINLIEREERTVA